MWVANKTWSKKTTEMFKLSYNAKIWGGFCMILSEKYGITAYLFSDKEARLHRVGPNLIK